ncbi:MAG: hypothetical protein EPO22_07975, partial [Dehalococcoidia bacterium]
LLRSLVKCGTCGLNFSGTMGRGVVWYRCNGQIAWRGRLKGKCPAKSMDGRVLEPIVWEDVLRWLQAPGDVIRELAEEQNAGGAAATAEAERVLVASALTDIGDQRNRILDVFRRGRISEDEFNVQMDAIADEQRALEKRLAELEPVTIVPEDVVSAEALLSAVRERVAAELQPSERQEIVSLLVRSITVRTEVVDGKKDATVAIDYRFPAVTTTGTGTGSARRRA